VTALLVEELAQVPSPTALHAAQPARYPFLLDSAAQGPLGRYSLLLRSTGAALVQERSGLLHGPGSGVNFLERLQQWYLAEAVAGEALPLPFLGGWFLYLGYELAAQIEPVLQLPEAAPGLPVAFAARCDAALIVQHGDLPRAWLVAQDAQAMQQFHSDLQQAVPAAAGTATVAGLQSDAPEQFTAAVERIHHYLRAGDVFQVNLSRGWRGEFEQSVAPSDVYHNLRAANPAPFAGLARWGDSALLSSSPERLVQVRGREAQVRPIAGTHPRGADVDSDRALSREMLANPKERAEHIMLIDLERNDLGRVCEAGSVEVNELMVVESYAHVHHIVSNVRGRLRRGVTPVEVIRAVFPGGTITGCPKVRCMQIIAELEGAGRGFYTGSMGYLDRFGNMDLNILIRSMQINGRQFSFRTGAGIVIDSDPQRELRETEAKARGLLRALQGKETTDA
jgi:anthranilate synthase component 1